MDAMAETPGRENKAKRSGNRLNLQAIFIIAEN
jgi:hypothetical protein